MGKSKGSGSHSNEKGFDPCSKVLLKKLVIAHAVKKFAVLIESKGSLSNVCVVITLAMVMLLRDLGPYEILFFSVCVVITVVMVMLLRDVGPYGIVFMITCVYYLEQYL
jgi:hypothetical protein